MNNARRGRASQQQQQQQQQQRPLLPPPRLIITRTKTPPKILPPVKNTFTKRYSSCKTSICMASLTKQLSPTFPCSTTTTPTSSSSSPSSPSPISSTSSSPGHQQHHYHHHHHHQHQHHPHHHNRHQQQYPISGYRCHSNPTSPNFLHPKCFSFSSSPSLVHNKRPSSVTRYGRQSPNSPTSPNSSTTTTTTTSLLIVSPSQPIGTRRSPTRSLHWQHNGPTTASFLSNQTQREIKTSTTATVATTTTTGTTTTTTTTTTAAAAAATFTVNAAATFSGGHNNKVYLINNQLEKNSSSTSENVHRQKLILNRTRQMSERSEYNIVHYSSKGSQVPKMNSSLGRVTTDQKDPLTSITQTQLPSKLEKENESNVESKCQEDGHEDQSDQTKWPRSQHSKFKLLRQSFSVESVESPGPCQDFGIRDYLNLTGESIDNEEESSVTGDFNVGLGVRPPRFSIDSLDSTMSLLLEVNEAKEKLSAVLHHGARRRSDETGGLLRKTTLVLNESTVTNPSSSSVVANADSRNHGDCNHPKTSSGKILRKCNSMPHTSLPKIHEGSYTIVGTKIPSEGINRRLDLKATNNNKAPSDHRDMMKASREDGTIEEIDDAEWETNNCTELEQVTTHGANEEEQLEEAEKQHEKDEIEPTNANHV